MTRRATHVGYTNAYGQTIIGRMDVIGRTDAVYVLRCEDCGLEYSSYGANMTDRRCPHDDPHRLRSVH